MRRYTLLQAPFCFYQTAFSRDVAQNWQRKSFAYFFLLIAYVNVFVAFVTYQRHKEVYTIVSSDYLNELPKMTFIKGKSVRAIEDKVIQGRLGTLSLQTQAKKTVLDSHAMILDHQWLIIQKNAQTLRIPVELLAVTLQTKNETLDSDELTKRLSLAFQPNLAMQYLVCYFMVLFLAFSYILFISGLHFLSRRFLVAASEAKLDFTVLLRLSLGSSLPFFAICCLCFLYGNLTQMTVMLASIVHMIFFNVAVSCNLYKSEE